MLINTAWLCAMIVVSALLYIRIAPTDADAWNIDPMVVESPGMAGVLVRREGGDIAPAPLSMPAPDLLARLDAIIRATPRTRQIAGSVAEGRITYVTRSLIFGFPDYATVSAAQEGAQSVPVIYSRLRFGASDTGVNRARVRKWLEALDQAR